MKFIGDDREEKKELMTWIVLEQNVQKKTVN